MLTLTVIEKKPVAIDIVELGFASPPGVQLPGFAAGAHIDLHLGPDCIRQYSLVNPSDCPEHYRIAVARDANTRGGSSFVHDQLQVGQTIEASEPRNHFPLVANAREHVFIAGGIGVTPILAMIRHCERIGYRWTLNYATRSRQRCAYASELELHGDRVCFHHDDISGGPIKVEAALPEPAPGRHLYCCGPEPLMRAVHEATASWLPDHVHFEWFKADSSGTNTLDESFEIVLGRSGKRLTVPASKSVLQVLRENGVPIASVCSEGVCGTCETAVLSGDVDHRDKVLTEIERKSNATMMVCCSRARGEIILDI